MSNRTIKIAAAGAAVVAGPAVAAADDSYPSLELAIEGGLTFSDYSDIAGGKVGNLFDTDIGGYGAISIGRAFDAGSPYDWRLTGTITQFQDNIYSDFYDEGPYSSNGELGTGFGFQTIDFDIGRNAYVRDNVHTRIFGGIRGMHLRTKNEFDFSKVGGPPPESYQFGKVGETEFLGAGPRIGGEFRAGDQWGIVGGLSGSAIYGRRTFTISSDYQGSYNGDSYGPYSYGGSNSEYDWITELTASIGVSYKPNDSTEIVGGYRAQKLWNVVGDYGSSNLNNPTVHGPYLQVKTKF
ncbi:Lpg1974 family pore-forming outer membrane protein [Oricola sp.]|uniref:Lpg1974 family pore-forming outer membrane protein n=1 Tax=Oricola sp. TaxID=1979950 RepID=UPI003BAC2A2E